MKVDIGPERIIFTDGIQPFGFKTRSGAIVVQAQLSFPPAYERPQQNAFPGLPGNIISRDCGQTWQRWLPAPEQGLGPTIEGSATTLRDGTILLLEWVADAPDEGGMCMGRLWESRDDFQTLEGPIACAIDLPQARTGFDDQGHPYSGVTFHRTILELPNGDLLATIYCWFEGDDTPVPYQPRMKKTRVVVLRSQNRGRVWKYLATVAVDPSVGTEGFDEPVMTRISRGEYAGRLVCIMRTGGIDCALYQAHSDDNGATWSSPRELALRGVDPDLIEMQDGTLVCSYGLRMKELSERRRYYLALSKDGAETWQIEAMPPLEAHARTFPPGSWGSETETHYSTVLETAPGVLLLIYDVGFWGNSVRYIASRTIEVSE